MNLPQLAQLSKIDLVGERRAVALLCLSFYATLFTLMGLIVGIQLPEWAPCFFGLGACYGIGFFAVAAGWFWGRWFAIGLGYSGLTITGMSIVATHELHTPMVVFGVMHGLVALCLLGEKMAAQYDARTEWRQRWKLDDRGALKLQRSVTRAASGLPTMIMWALAPRPDGETAALLGLAALGLSGVLRGRTWGVVLLGTTGAMTVALTAAGYFPALGVLSGGLLIAAVCPFILPALAYLRPDR